MSADLERVAYTIDAFGEGVAGHESMTQWLIDDPSARYRLRGALGTFNIEPARIMDLGYSSHEFIDMNQFVEHFDLPIAPESRQGRDVGLAFLHGCMELRDDLGAFLGKGQESNRLETFSKLPAFLQYLAAYKVIGDLDAGYMLTKPEPRAKLQQYFTERLNVSEPTAVDILRSSAIVHANEVLEGTMTFARDSDLDVLCVDPSILAGPTSPETGIYLGHDLEQAVIQSVNMAMGHVLASFVKGEKPQWMDKHHLAQQQRFADIIHSALDIGVALAGRPESEMELWRSYLMTKAIFAQKFQPSRHGGFDGGLDQLVSWTSPVPDGEYEKRLGYGEWLEAAEGISTDPRGVALAKQAFVLDTLSSAELEIILGRDTRRDGRIRAAAKLLHEVKEVDPELVEQVLVAHGLLRQALLSKMDPWGHRFR